MKKHLVLLCVLLVLGASVAAFWSFRREKPMSVSVQAVKFGTVSATVSNTRAGSIKARLRARLTPSLAGWIEKLDVQEGDHVAKGQELLRIWNKNVQAELLVAKFDVQAMQAAQNEACLLAKQADRQARRLAELRQSKSTSESLYEEAQATAQARNATCTAANARLALSQAKVEAVQAQLEQSVLRAPFAGIVAEVNGEVGEFLTPSPPGIATLPAIDLINMDSLYVAAPIDEIDAAQIKSGQKAHITLDAYPGKTFAGTVSRVSPYVLELEKQARTVEIEANFDNPNDSKGLLAGYSADMEIILKESGQVLRIPSEAIVDGNAVFVFDRASKRIERRTVTTGISNWQYTEVTSGLRENEWVVSSVDRQGVKDKALAKVDKEPHD